MRSVCLRLSVGLSLAALSGAQQQPPATEIYMVAWSFDKAKTVVGAVVNISNSPGYDNQPSFLPDGSGVLFTSNRDGKQTDIYRNDFAAKSVTQLTRTSEGEYSPLVTPDGKTFRHSCRSRWHAAALAIRSRRHQSAPRPRERETGRLSRVDRRDAPRVVHPWRSGAAQHTATG